MPHLPKPVTVGIEYSDADGIETRRTVDVYRTAKAKGYTRITGFCHGRQAERTFRSDRISAIITEDGEVISAAEFLGSLGGDGSSDVQMRPIASGDEEETILEKIGHFLLGAAVLHSGYLWIVKDGTTAITALAGYLAVLWLLRLAVRRIWPDGDHD